MTIPPLVRHEILTEEQVRLWLQIAASTRSVAALHLSLSLSPRLRLKTPQMWPFGRVWRRTLHWHRCLSSKLYKHDWKTLFSMYESPPGNTGCHSCGPLHEKNIFWSETLLQKKQKCAFTRNPDAAFKSNTLSLRATLLFERLFAIHLQFDSWSAPNSL